MIKNLFKTRASKPATSAPLSEVAVEGSKRLKEAEQGLQTVMKDYAAGRTMGHPEETLEIIEDFQMLIARLKKAQKRGWVPSEKVIKEIEFDIEMQRNFMISNNYSQEDIAGELAWRQRNLEEAKQGLR